MQKMMKISELIDEKISGEWGTESVDENGVNVLRTTNFTNEGIINYSEVVKRNISQSLIDKKKLLFGDTIIEKSGGSPNQPVGRVVYFDNSDNENYLCNNFTSILRSSSSIESKYFFYALFYNHQSKRTLKYQNKTTGIINLQLDRYLDEKIFIPKDKAAQKKIVSLLDKADSIRKKRKETIKLADEFLRSTFLEMFGDPVNNPFNWKELPFSKLAEDKENAIRRGPFGSSLRKDMFVPAGYLVYEQYHALNNDFKYKRYFIDENKFEELKAFKVQPGDFIISCSGVYLGKLAEVPQDSPIGVINQALLKITLDKNVINNKYFRFVFSYPGMQNKMFSSQRGSGIPNFPPMSVVNEFMFPIPPIDLQNKFAEIVEKTEKLKEKYRQSLEESENLFNSLMQKAFKGEL